MLPRKKGNYKNLSFYLLNFLFQEKSSKSSKNSENKKLYFNSGKFQNGGNELIGSNVPKKKFFIEKSSKISVN